MTTEQVWLAAGCALATVVALVAVLLAARAQRRAVRAEERAVALAERLAERLALLERPAARAPSPADDEMAYVITRVDGPGAAERQAPVAQPIDGRLFADIVARETVVKAASWTHGLRRALSADNRDRIRLAVRQETRRAGRERRAEVKQALREHRARERAGVRTVTEDVA